ncbi:HepT-like ribonuclease domain-containing protein [Coleofasciculus sp. E2-BRE-01]|jgi:uncharacterized protein with HEPN domain|uniref:HepT-like ribonuclease domain-containing protein n=1 Tax=unclassified Coleofasciculus TaxID=2692782 RepID=UPI0032F96AD8
MKNQILYLTNIQDCIQAIENYTHEGKQAFFTNKMMQDAVIRNLEIIGEATKRLSEEIITNYPNVPWRQMAGLRDVLIHDYLKVDLEEVWLVVETDIPPLKVQIQQILDTLTT